MSSLLTKAESNFLAQQGFSESDVYDGRRQTRDAYRRNAKEHGKSIVLARPCNRAGHRLKTRSGHCIQCDTSKLEYERRHNANGYIYIAYSANADLTKIGSTRLRTGREESLNESAYAGQRDWKLTHSVKVNGAGAVEKKVQGALKKHSVEGYFYSKGRQRQRATEVFRVSEEKAKQTIDAIISSGKQATPAKGMSKKNARVPSKSSSETQASTSSRLESNYRSRESLDTKPMSDEKVSVGDVIFGVFVFFMSPFGAIPLILLIVLIFGI